MKPQDLYDQFLSSLCVWRESRGEPAQAWVGVAWSIKNRADRPSWWGGPTLASVVLKPFQYSSFNRNDPNATLFPPASDPIMLSIIDIVGKINLGTIPDPTNGATHYFDKSLDDNPPSWAKELTHTVDLGALHFYK